MPVDHEALHALWRSAANAWPSVELAFEPFADWVSRFDDGAALSWHELYLACACVRGDAAAIAHFEKSYVSTVPRHLARATRDGSLIEDVQQRLRERALLGSDHGEPALASYSGRGSLEAWVRVVAARLHLDHTRRQDDRAREESREIAAPEGLSPELLALRARCGPELARSLRDALAELSPRERALFRMHYLDGVSLERIAPLYGVNKSTVSRWLSGARQAVLDRAARSVRDSLGVTDDSVAALVSLVGSQLDVSLSALLD